MNKVLLGVGFGLLAALIILARFSCNEADPARIVYLDSLAQDYLSQRDAALDRESALAWQLKDQHVTRRLDSTVWARRNAALTVDNNRLKKAVAAYQQDRTLENCDTLLVAAGDVSHRVDSLQTIVAAQQQNFAGIMKMCDEAVMASNDRAQKSDAFALRMQEAARQCELRGIPQRESWLAIGPQIGYGMTQYGLTPYAGIGVTVKINLRKNKLK